MSDDFPPPFLWPYIRYLSLLDRCGQAIMPNRLVCRIFRHSSPFLKEVLHAMPKLSSLTVSMEYDESHGLCLESLEVFLSLPHLREFVVDGFSFCPRRFPEAEARAASGALAPLTSFRLRQNESRRPPRSFPPERDALAFVLETFHSTLESLELPIESPPLNSLTSLSWPHLRELRLSGEYPDAGLPTPLVSLFSSMPPLRVLELHFALPTGTPRPLLLPQARGHPSASSAPPAPPALSALAELSISFPDPADAIYAALPKTLRRLALRCCPHHCLRRWAHFRAPPGHWHSPVLSASELIRVLRRCDAPALDRLRVEYVAAGGADADADVLQAIASAFPALGSLEMSRFRAPEGPDVSIPHLSRALAGLGALRSLRLHLDFSDVPRVAGENERTGVRYLSAQEIGAFRETLRGRAALLLRGLQGGSGPPLEELWLLERGHWPCAQWVRFRVGHGGSGDSESPDKLDVADEREYIIPTRF